VWWEALYIHVKCKLYFLERLTYIFVLNMSLLRRGTVWSGGLVGMCLMFMPLPLTLQLLLPLPLPLPCPCRCPCIWLWSNNNFVPLPLPVPLPAAQESDDATLEAFTHTPSWTSLASHCHSPLLLLLLRLTPPHHSLGNLMHRAALPPGPFYWMSGVSAVAPAQL